MRLFHVKTPKAILMLASISSKSRNLAELPHWELGTFLNPKTYRS